MSSSANLPFHQRRSSGPLVGLPVILLGLAATVFAWSQHLPLLVFSGIATAGLGATAWVGLHGLAKDWAEHRAKTRTE